MFSLTSGFLCFFMAAPKGLLILPEGNAAGPSCHQRGGDGNQAVEGALSFGKVENFDLENSQKSSFDSKNFGRNLKKSRKIIKIVKNHSGIEFLLV